MSAQSIPKPTPNRAPTSKSDSIPKIVCFNEAKVDHLRLALPSEAEFEGLAEVFKAVAHAGRLAVLRLVTLEECCVCDVAHTLEIPVSTASQHLRTLKRAGLLRSRSEGRLVFYSPATNPTASTLGVLLRNQTTGDVPEADPEPCPLCEGVEA